MAGRGEREGGTTRASRPQESLGLLLGRVRRSRRTLQKAQALAALAALTNVRLRSFHVPSLGFSVRFVLSARPARSRACRFACLFGWLFARSSVRSRLPQPMSHRLLVCSRACPFLCLLIAGSRARRRRPVETSGMVAKPTCAETPGGVRGSACSSGALAAARRSRCRCGRGEPSPRADVANPGVNLASPGADAAGSSSFARRTQCPVLPARR